MPGLTGSVGRNGANARADVTEVQTLLNTHIPSLPPLGLLTVDGVSGSATIRAIMAFQARVVGMANPDGRIDPGGRSYARLTGSPTAIAASTAGTTPLPPPAVIGRFHYAPGTQAPLADIATPYIGATEARGNGMGTDPRMREIFEADHLMNGDRTDGYAWCCSFVSMCVQKLIAQTPAYSHVRAPRTASVSNFRTSWAPGQNCLVFRPGDPVHSPSRGDVVVYTFSHIGIVTGATSSGVTTIEGNTNAAGSREGTSVLAKERANSLVRCFIRLPLIVAAAETGAAALSGAIGGVGAGT